MISAIQQREDQQKWQTSLQNIAVIRNTYSMGSVQIPANGMFPVQQIDETPMSYLLGSITQNKVKIDLQGSTRELTQNPILLDMSKVLFTKSSLLVIQDRSMSYIQQTFQQQLSELIILQIQDTIPLEIKNKSLLNVKQFLDQFDLIIITVSMIQEFQKWCKSSLKIIADSQELHNIQQILRDPVHSVQYMSDSIQDIINQSGTLEQKLPLFVKKRRVATGLGFERVIIYDFEQCNIKKEFVCKILWLLSNAVDNDKYSKFPKKLQNWLPPMILSQKIKKLVVYNKENHNKYQIIYQQPPPQQFCHVKVGEFQLPRTIYDLLSAIDGWDIDFSSLGCQVNSLQQVIQDIRQQLEFKLLDIIACKFHVGIAESPLQIEQQLTNFENRIQSSMIDSQSINCSICMQDKQKPIVFHCCYKLMCFDCFVLFCRQKRDIPCPFCRTSLTPIDISIIAPSQPPISCISLIQRIVQQAQSQKTVILYEQVGQYLEIKIAIKILHYLYLKKQYPQHIDDISFKQTPIYQSTNNHFVSFNHQGTISYQNSRIPAFSQIFNNSDYGVFNLKFDTQLDFSSLDFTGCKIISLVRQRDLINSQLFQQILRHNLTNGLDLVCIDFSRHIQLIMPINNNLIIF